MGVGSCWAGMQDLCRARLIKANRCLLQLHGSLRHGNLRGFSFVEGMFCGVNIPCTEAFGLEIVWVGDSALKAIFISEIYHSLEWKGCKLSMKTSRGVPSRANSYIGEPLMALAVVENILKRKQILEK